MRTTRLHSLLALALVACSDAAVGTDNGWQPTDDWPTATPQSVGVDAALLVQAREHIARNLPNVDALLLVRNGQLVFESYFHGYSGGTLHEMRSITKSVVSAMAGIAIANGWIDSLGATVADLLPRYMDASVPAERRQITARQLITMSSGLTFDSERTEPITQGSLVLAFLRGPSWGPPGVGYRYDSSNPHLLSAAITERAGQPLAHLADISLFSQIGMGAFEWYSDSEGFSMGATGLSVTARDLARLGELYLRDGVWRGKRILPGGWVDATTTSAFDLGDGDGYGYLWWTIGNLGSRAYAAVGYRQQWLLVLPELDAVIVMLGETTDLRGPETNHFHVITQYLIPALAGAPQPAG